MLSFVPGEVPRNPLPPETAGDDVLVALARLIRALREASAGWAPPPGAVWGGTPGPAGQIAGRAELVSHRDYYPGNVVFRDGLPVALIDFDLAMPTTRLYDIANALWYWAPLRDPAGPGARVRGRRHPAPGRGVRRRLRHDSAASRGAGAVRRRHGAPLSRGFPRLGRTGPGVPQAMGGRRQGRAAARRGMAARGGPGDHRSPRPPASASPGAARRQDQLPVVITAGQRGGRPWPRAACSAPGCSPRRSPRHPRPGPGVRRRHRVGARLRDQRRRLRDGRAGKALGGHSLREGAAEGPTPRT